MPKLDLDFTEQDVDFVSSFLQGHMARHNIAELTPDQCAELLNKSGILEISEQPERGFRFREMLRKGRRGELPQVDGAWQENGPRTPWHIDNILRK